MSDKRYSDAEADWESLLSSAARLQKILPDAVLVGGTAVNIRKKYRMSYDADHILSDLRDRFDAVLGELEQAAGWTTSRVKRPVLILGSLDGVDTGIRQLIRSEPLETERLEIFPGSYVTVPTLDEILRIKAALILKRNAARDYLDFAALSSAMRTEAVADAFARFDELYPQPNGESPTMQLQIQLAAPKPYDLDGVNLSNYKDLSPEWRDWAKVKDECIRASLAVSRAIER